MSYKYYIPEIKNEWDAYWKSTSIEKELKLTQTDGLRLIFNKYLPKNGKIIEAGCGMGKWIIYLSKKGYDILGIDNNRYALTKLRKTQPQVKTRLADITNLPYKDESFDAYLSLGVIEHFEEGPQKALQEANRILKTGGLAIIEVPYDSPLRKLKRKAEIFIMTIKSPLRIIFEILGLKKPHKAYKKIFYEYRYEKKELLKFINQAGFKHIKVLPKDDLAHDRSIALWLDFPVFQNKNGQLFKLNSLGVITKKVLEAISPFTYRALIVAVARKV